MRPNLIDLFKNLAVLSQVPLLELAAHGGKFPVFFGEVVRKLRFLNNSNKNAVTIESGYWFFVTIYFLTKPQGR
jgi:hypothetical protein